jgi:prefoldin subunit 5
MALDPDLLETIHRIIDSRIEPIRVHREEHEELKAAVRRLEESHTRVEEELAGLARAQRETQESLLSFQRTTEEHLNALTEAQVRIEQRLEALAQAQTRTEQRLEELAQAQARTEQRLEELAQAQARTEEALARTNQRVEELAQAQARTEEALARTNQRVEELAQAQARTEEALARTNQRLEELAQAQTRTEQALAQLAEAVRDLRREVGGLSERVGADLEEIGRIVAAEFLREQEGIEVPSLEGRFLRLDGEEIEVDLFGEGRRGDESVVVIGECKARVYPREIQTFHRRSERLARSLGKPVVRVVYCQRVHPDAERFAREAGIIFVPWSYQHRIWAQGT